VLARHPERIASLADLDNPPKPVSRRPPVYPSKLEATNEPGSAIIEFIIDEEGDAQLPRIVSSTATEFGYAAAQAVATWRFEPPTVKNKAVLARGQITVEFKAGKGNRSPAHKAGAFPDGG
jgi:TonB family protein